MFHFLKCITVANQIPGEPHPVIFFKYVAHDCCFLKLRYAYIMAIFARLGIYFKMFFRGSGAAVARKPVITTMNLLLDPELNRKMELKRAGLFILGVIYSYLNHFIYILAVKSCCNTLLRSSPIAHELICRPGQPQEPPE
jgi:hypothetical protein